MKRRGFTVIEILIVIVLITILTLLGVASLRSSQLSARDDERQTKAETIARALDSFYALGDSSRGIAAGRYPSGVEIQDAIDGNYLLEWLDGADEKTLHFSWQDADEINLEVLSTTDTPSRDQTEDPSRINPAVASGKLIYEPLAAWVGSRPNGDNDRWASCHDTSVSGTPTCQRFNIYYEKESDGSVVTIRSKNQ